MNRRIVVLAGIATAGLMAAGCSSSSTASTTTTTATPATTTPASTTGSGTASTGLPTPDAVAAAFVTSANSGNFTTFCSTAVPSQVTKCNSDTGDVVSEKVTFSDWTAGKITTQGDQAILNFTGKTCHASQCVSNSDTNIAQSKGQSFAAAYAAALNPNSPNASPFVGSAVKVNGSWYAVGF